jgi:hypothetical protein
MKEKVSIGENLRENNEARILFKTQMGNSRCSAHACTGANFE